MGNGAVCGVRSAIDGANARTVFSLQVAVQAGHGRGQSMRVICYQLSRTHDTCWRCELKSKILEILAQASNHRGVAWVLRQDRHSVSAASDLLPLRRCQSRLVALLPAKRIILHPMSRCQDSRWDSQPDRFSPQLWQMRLQLVLLPHCSPPRCALV